MRQASLVTTCALAPTRAPPAFRTIPVYSTDTTSAVGSGSRGRLLRALHLARRVHDRSARWLSEDGPHQSLDEYGFAPGQPGRKYINWNVVPCTFDGVVQDTHSGGPHINKKSNPVRLVPPVSPDPAAPVAVSDNVRLDWTDYLASAGCRARLTQRSPRRRAPRLALQIQVARDLQFTQIIDDTTVDQTTFTSFDTTYPDGPIYWRVQAIDKLLESPGMKRNGKFEKVSPKAQLLAPAQGASIEASAAFRWDPTPYARSYDIEVYSNNDRSAQRPTGSRRPPGGNRRPGHH